MNNPANPPEDKQQDNAPISDSEFHMWRALFSLVHADNVVTEEERDFMWRALDDNNFSNDQMLILKQEMEHPAGIDLMFRMITEQTDRSRFFELARVLCWSDGDFDEQEQEIMRRLKSVYLKTLDFDAIMGTKVNLELEQSKPRVKEVVGDTNEGQAGIWRRFLGRRGE